MAATKQNTRKEKQHNSSFSPSGMLKKIPAVVLLCILAWAYQVIQPPPPNICGSPSGPPITAPRIALKDGRHLAYKEHGVPKDMAKYKIIYVHGFDSCRHDALPLSLELAEELGVYLVSFDRAGYGESDPNPKRTVKSTATDIEELADQLELGSRFFVIGFSMGGQVVWTCLKYIPHRLAGAALIAPVGNFWWSGFPANVSREALNQHLAPDKWAIRVAHYLPWLTYWWNTQRWFPVCNVIAHSPDIFSPQDKMLLPKFEGRVHYQWSQAGGPKHFGANFSKVAGMEEGEGQAPKSPKEGEGQDPKSPKVLLYNQSLHVSEGIRQGEDFDRLRCIPTNPDRNIWQLTKQQKAYVRQAGLHYLAEIDRMVIDHALITGLVERWRPETNTFHFPSSEATITLEDVAYIYGLPVDGPPVAGRTFPGRFVASVCEEVLGIRPEKRDYHGITVKFKWLEDNFAAAELEKKKKHKKYKDYEINATRAYLFFLVSGQIVSQTTGARGPAYILELFKEFKPYAWAPACLANLYRMLTNASRWGPEKLVAVEEGKDKQGELEGHLCRTPTGPLQLLQIWAYTRMSIGRCPKPKDSWQGDIQFPLCKTWMKRLAENPPLTSVKEVRGQLNNLKVDEFIWQPYEGYSPKFFAKVSKVDRTLLHSSTVLIWYWIVERHNTWRVMKQFGLKQIVPPPFTMPILRRERTFRSVVDYAATMDKDVVSSWGARAQLGLQGEVCAAAAQSEEYMEWYTKNTLMFIGRGEAREQPASDVPASDVPTAEVPAAEQPASDVPASDVPTAEVPAAETRTEDEPTIPQKHAQDMVSRIERSLERSARRKTPIDKLSNSISKKLAKFKAGFVTNWENFSFDGCSSSASDNDATAKKITITFKHTKRPAQKSPAKKAKSAKRKSTVVEPNPASINAEGSGSSREQPPTDPAPQENVQTPPVSRNLFASPFTVSSESAMVVAAPLATLESLVWRIKRLPRMRKIPLKFEDYTHDIVRSDYVLSDGDKFFLKGFLEYYDDRKDELDDVCTLIKADDLKKVLDEGTWMDTNIIYYYFEILRIGCDSCFIADPSVCSWWRDSGDTAIEAVFGKYGHRVLDAREARTLIFIVYQRAHFTLLVGLVDEKRWEFYNSMDGDRRSFKHAQKFMGWLAESYSHFGWSDPFLWPLVEKTAIPRQTNTSDCGVFAMAFATHCVHRLPIAFRQSDMRYFRSKIVVEIFKRSWQLNANRLGLGHLQALP